MKKTSILFIFFIIQFQPVFAQNNSSKLSSTFENVYRGFSESFEWYDAIVGIGYLSEKYFPLKLENKIDLPQFSIDHEINEAVPASNKLSIGSMNKDIIPFSILIGRSLYNIGSNLFTNNNVNYEDYKHAFVFYKSLIYTYTLTEIVKNITYRVRPDGSDDRSFFSGHTSTTFAASAFLYREVDDYLDEWEVTNSNSSLRTGLKVTAFTVLYGWAGYVGYSRISDKKHYLSDVIIGGAVGTLIGNFLYSHYFGDDFSFLQNINLGYYNNSPALSFHLDF